MQPQFWHERWEAQQIGFHQNHVHVYLPHLWPQLQVPPGAQVFVPLCGKSLDMLWLLEQGQQVLGVEISPVAVSAFFADNGLTPTRQQIGAFEVWHWDKVTLLCGDFFDLQAHHLAQIGAVYDRASLIALPPSLRNRYAAHLASLLPPATPMLLVTLEYPHNEMNGPPFSVDATEVKTLFAPAFTLERLEQRDILATEPHLQRKGLTALSESAYHLVVK
jgi:thiopurine S-methyltransferase